MEDEKTFKYSNSTQNSIFFEVDGPYLAMVLPSAKEEGKKLKKRYAVFNHDKSLQELKGFEIKRRGELKLMKLFQEDLFKSFTEGSNLTEAYASAAAIANYWLDILDTKARALDDDELFEILTVNKNMSKHIDEYGSQKSVAITTAKRLAEIIGDSIFETPGLACSFIVSKEPSDLQVTQRCIPIEIFKSDSDKKAKLLSKWTGTKINEDFDIRDIIDWNHYKEKLSNNIRKIITFPAAFQNVIQLFI